MVTHLEVGSEVEIIATDNVLRRFPNLVGVHGIIETTPVHPNIWYTIYFKCLDATLKLQQNAVKLRQKKAHEKPKALQSPINRNQTTQKSKKQNREHIKNKLLQRDLQVDIDANEPKKNVTISSPGHSVVPVAHLKVGTRVIIIGTDNVHQRVPQLEGSIGVIKEAPGLFIF